jgi:hypothetical protein
LLSGNGKGGTPAKTKPKTVTGTAIPTPVTISSPPSTL